MVKERPNPRDRILRCLTCFARMDIPEDAKVFICPKCGIKYHIGWRNKQAKILGSEGP